MLQFIRIFLHFVLKKRNKTNRKARKYVQNVKEYCYEKDE